MSFLFAVMELDKTQMDDEGRAMCYALRNPPKGYKKVKLKDIAKLVRKSCGRKKVSLQAISLAANTYKDFLNAVLFF